MESRRHIPVSLVPICLTLAAGQVQSFVHDLSSSRSAGGDCAGAEAKRSSLLQMKTKLSVRLHVEVTEVEQDFYRAKLSAPFWRPKLSRTSTDQNVAEQGDRACARLGIEADVRMFQWSMRVWKEDPACKANAEKAFNEAIQAAGLVAELSEEEQVDFACRFVEEMLASCKHDTGT